MSIYDLVTLTGIMTILAITPSTSVALVIMQSATFGIMHGLAVSAGIVLGDLVFIGLAIWGLFTIVDAIGSLFILIKFLGGLYLLWFGYYLISKSDTIKATVNSSYNKENLAVSFMIGFILTLGDIKAITFYVSLLPLFIDVSTIQSRDVALIALITIVSVGGVKAIYAILANNIAIRTQQANINSKFRKMVGGLIACVGGYLIINI